MVKEGYKETIVGEIPEEWNFNPLKEVCKFKNGKSTDYYSNLEEGKYCIYGSNGPIGSLNESNFEKGYIVGRVGAVGEIHYIDEPVWVSDNAIQVSIKKNKKVDRRYLFYWLKRRNLGQFSTKSAQPLLNQSTIKTIPIPFPTLPEQKKIASILSSVDKSIEKTDEVIEETKELKKGLMQELLTKGIGHSEFKEVKALGKKYTIPKNWSLKELNEVLKVIRNGSSKKQNKQGEGLPVSRIETIADGTINYDKVGYVDLKPEDLKKHKLEKGDILFSHINSISHIGKVAQYKADKKLYHGMNLLKLRFDNEIVTNQFMLHRLKSIKAKHFYERYAKQAVNQASLNQKDVGLYTFPVPPLKEQKKIASILSSVDAKIKKEEEYKAKLERLKKGLMQKLLTGEIRVNTEMEV